MLYVEDQVLDPDGNRIVYNVSGEYAMLKMAGSQNLIDYDRVVMETMVSFKRAGADIIISYHAKEVAKILQK